MSTHVYPDYRGGSIVNLMRTIMSSYGHPPDDYPVSSHLDPAALQSARNVLLLVVDGLGYEYLARQGEASALRQHLIHRMTSVAPPTTATAISTFLTGQAPQQHGLTGWFTWFRELGSVLAVLPFTVRSGNLPLVHSGISAAALYGHTPVFDSLEVQSHVICPDWIAHSAFNRAHLGGASLLTFDGLAGCFTAVARSVRSGDERKYLYAYWPGFDSRAHAQGVGSDEVAAHFAELDDAFARLLDALAGTDTAVIVTADHGFVDIPGEGQIALDEHRVMKRCLTLPLCGEQRLCYAYVQADKRARFEDYIDRHLDHAVDLFHSEDLLQRDLFGLGEPHPELSSRIGDYILVMKPGYVMRDRIPGERELTMTGYHGGLSAQEMYVPLVYVHC